MTKASAMLGFPSYTRSMGVDLHRDYGALEPLPDAARNDHEATQRWGERRSRDLVACEQRGDYLQAASSGWDAAFTLGVLYGWRPAGTRHDDPDWEGGYFSNDGARVTVEDARALGSALERALGDPDPVAVSPVQRIKGLPAHLRELLGDDRDYVRGVLERLTSADTREDLDRYVRFLRRGSFTIE